MAGDSIHYKKDGEDFVLIHEMYGSVEDWKDDRPTELYRGKEVAIGFTYDPDADRGIQFTTHRHGSPETVEDWANKTRFALHRSRFTREAREKGETAAAILRSMMPHIISTDQWDIEDLNRIISTTGYLKVVLDKMGINLSSEE